MSRRAGALCSTPTTCGEPKLKKVDRRHALKSIAAVPAVVVTGCRSNASTEEKEPVLPVKEPEASPVLDRTKLEFVWKTLDPFLFCVHHNDHYPRGNDAFGPAASLQGRDMGQDFAGKDGWRMYHGMVVPGFPQHPHRGFETVTVVRRGLLDHSDSMGAGARYGEGDVQWLTAGRGIQHAEMFPLLRKDRDNPVELFQIWLNLPRADKFAEPHFTMLWSETVPKRTLRDAEGKKTEVAVIAGALADAKAPSPPPKSWAAKPQADVAIWTLKLEPGASFELPPARQGTHRMLYFFAGDTVEVANQTVKPGYGLRLQAERKVTLVAGSAHAELLLLQGRPIGEPVAQHGPFVMNTREEIVQAFHDYQETRFGEWTWGRSDPVHGAEEARFARHADGRVEKPV